MAAVHGWKRKNTWIEIPIGEVHLEAPLHRADWPRRAEVVPDFARRVAAARASGKWPGEPIRVRAQGQGYVLVSGFSRLAVASEAGLASVRAYVEPAAQRLPLAQIHLRPWQEQARLNPAKLAQRREQATRSGALPVPLVVRPARGDEPAAYTLLDGLYWYRVASEMAMAEVPAVVLRAGRRQPTAVRGARAPGQGPPPPTGPSDAV